ncbi:MAG TPA: T9SS type A sorting domain-containing protein [Bacteroidota bacterium]|nr:T9SS type A sorting domain-containing protein [Bacteroidota bacterium]
MTASIGVRSCVLILALLAVLSVPIYSQWAPGSTIHWYVDGSVNALNFEPSTANVQQEIEDIMNSIADDWVYACGLNLSVIPGYGSKTIKIMAGNLQGLPNQTIAITDPIPTNCTNSNFEVVITLNWSAQLVYRDAVDEVYMRDLSQENFPYYNIDIRTVLLHELAHAFGMDGEGGVGVLSGSYHGSDREIDGEEAQVFRNMYLACHGLPTRKWQRVRTNFDDGNPFHASTNGWLWSNMWSPRVTPGAMVQKASGWTVSWEIPPYPNVPIYPTVQADAYQQIGSTRKKFWRWQPDDELTEYEAEFDYAIVIDDHAKIAKAWYSDVYPYTLTAGEYCDGSPAPCIYNVFNTHVPTPYSSDVAPEFEPSPYVEVEPVNSGDLFLYWRDNNGNRHLSANMMVNVQQYSTLTPVFQKHLTSTHTVSDQVSESGTSSNNQRKIAFVNSSPAMHHQVYESCGQIFYCNSTNQGQNWSEEFRLSSLASTEVEKPSIFADGDSVWVTWSENSEIHLVKFHPSNPSAKVEYDCSNLYTPRDGFTPVITRISYNGSSFVYVAYEADAVLIAWALFKDGIYHSRGDVVSLPLGPDDDVPTSPSIVAHNALDFDLVWRKGTVVWYRRGHIEYDPKSYTYSILWFATEEMVPLGNRPAVGAPTISYCKDFSGGNVNAAIACETGASAPYGVGLTFRRPSGVWWHVQTFIIANEVGRLWAPSISMLNEQAIWSGFEHFRIAYNYTDNFVSGVPTTRQVWAMQPAFDSYGNLIDYPVEIQGPDALHPSVVTRPPAGGNLSIFTGLSGTAMNMIDNRYDGLNKSQSINWYRSRELSMRIDTTIATFGLANIRTATGTLETPVTWHRGVDSAIVGVDISVENDFRTAPFNVSAGTRLKYLVTDTKNGLNQIPSSMQLGLEIRDAGSDALLGIIGTLIPNSVQNGKRVADMNINLAAYAGHAVYLRLALSGNDSTVVLHAQDIWSVVPLNSANFPKDWSRYTEESSPGFTPDRVVLEQNYPNPFNPSTTIVYSIPEQSRVILTVHDVLGRLVASLVDEVRTAGAHTVVFDASNLPGGSYFYRLATGSTLLTRQLTVVK